MESNKMPKKEQNKKPEIQSKNHMSSPIVKSLKLNIQLDPEMDYKSEYQKHLNLKYQ